MSSICSCDAGYGSLFVGGCKGLIGIIDRMIVVPAYDNNGVRNFLDLATVPIPKNTFDSNFKNPNGSKRWHISPSLMNVEWAQADNNLQTFNGGQTVVLSKGVTSLSLMVINVTPQEASRYEGLQCGEGMVYFTTIEGQLIGYATRDNVLVDKKMFGLPVDSISVTSTPVKTDASVSNVMITINFKKSMMNANIVTAEPDEMLVDWSTYLEPKGATLTLNASPAVASTTATVRVTSDYYGITGAQGITGLAVGDFVLTNAGSAVAISAVVESSLIEGQYALTFATSAASSLELVIAPTSNVNVISNTLTIVTP